MLTASRPCAGGSLAAVSAAGTRKRQPRLPLEVRRQQVLDAALDLIVDSGFAGATMEAISRRAGLAKTVVYNAYRRLDPLLEALIERENARALEPLLAPLENEHLLDSDPQAVLAAWIDRMVDSILADPKLWRLVLMPPEGAPPALRAAIRDGRDAARRRLVELIEPLAAKRPEVADVDPYWMSHALLAVCEHFAGLIVAEPEQYTRERIQLFAHRMLGMILS